MTREPADHGVLRRHFVAIATSTYDDPTWEPLSGVEDEVKVLREWLCAPGLGPRRFDDEIPELADNPTEDAIRAALKNPPPQSRWRAGDAAVVFVTGHGTTRDGSHWTILQATEADRLQSTALRTADLVGWLGESDVQHLFLVLDLCYAGHTILETAAFSREIPRTWLVLPSATKNEQAVTGALTTAIAAFLRDLSSPVGQQFGLDPLVNVTDFLDAVEERLGPGQRLIPLPGSQRSGPHPGLPNPHYRANAQVRLERERRDLAVAKEDLVAGYWDPRARGVGRGSDPGWLFTGRYDLMRHLIAAIRGPAETVLVTGCAGSGKSAVLARLVTLSDRMFLAQHGEQVAQIPDDLRPAPGAVDAAVLATGKTADEVLAQICLALGVPYDPTVPTAEGVDAFREWLAERRAPVTLVVDAMDEATIALAQVLAAHAGRSFLVTRLAAASLAHRPQPVDPTDPRWLTTISDGVLGVFRDDLRAIVPERQDRLRAVHLLRAVAFAYGRGLPWRQIWPAVANAVARDPERTYGDTDIAWLLGSRLGGYLINDREDDVTVYRLFHDTLRSTLRERWRELIGDGLSEGDT
ncbi:MULTISPECIES: ATP-binding protein [Streptacidiphilus]|uniref:AAA family ATPase n=1 Tax=Streptacidiphilus cavernicola TaxID=3342716 RepID=A0ABV6UK23_9ACTN|nr:ATP-binding protein [Streptacidiphilus jeojiense]